MALLEVKSLRVAFGSDIAVDGVSFALNRGGRLGIVGESGSGKSLTAYAITGLLPEGARKAGWIKLNNFVLPEREKDMARVRGRRIAMIFQEPMTALNPLMKVGKQIEEAVRLSRPKANAWRETGGLLKEVGLEPQHAGRYPHALSGGQRQRVLIAMALAGEPELLIADEPTSALDLITQRRVLELIADISQRRGMGLLFISHDLRAVAALCPQVLVLHRGKLVESGPTELVFGSPRHAHTRELVASLQAPSEQPPAKADSGKLLQATGITRRFERGPHLPFLPGAKFPAVNEVSFTLHEGQSLAIVGPSGSGKTTLARIIAGLDRASRGELVFKGRSYRGDNLPKDLRHEISLVFQDPFGSFDPRMTIADSLGEPLLRDRRVRPLERAERVAQAVEAVGLDRDMLDRFPHEFSGGQRQRLAIARALVTRPSLVVLDEPVSALDMSVRGEVLSLLNSLRGAFGLTYIVISHDLDMVASVADWVMVMEHGRVVETGAPGQLFANPQHPLTQELIAARLPHLG